MKITDYASILITVCVLIITFIIINDTYVTKPYSDIKDYEIKLGINNHFGTGVFDLEDIK